MRIGVFGGSFDPPHLGHLVVALDALEMLELDRVCFVTAHRSPFKADDADRAPAGLRHEMVAAAVAGEPRFEVSRSELDRDPPSYTVDTLRAFAAERPGVEWTLLLGLDQWRGFDAWKEPDAVARLARIAVLDRDGEGAAVVPRGGVPHRRVPVTRIDVSSTAIRERVRAGRSIRYLVPDPVRAVIEANGLYLTC